MALVGSPFALTGLNFHFLSVVTVGPVKRSVGDRGNDGRVGFRRCREVWSAQLCGNHDRRRRRFGNEIRSLNGHEPFQMNFKQRGIADIQDMIGRIDIQNGLICRAVIEPGDRMRRYGCA